MKHLLPALLLCLASFIGVAQPTSATVSFLESRLTRSFGGTDYTQYFRFEEGHFPDRFTVIQAENTAYAVYNIQLRQIAAMDIVSGDAIALTLTFHEPLAIALRDALHGTQIGSDKRQTLTFSLQNFREALHVQRALQSTDDMLDFRIRMQESHKEYPEMIAMPKIQARPAWLGRYPVTVQEYRTYCYARQEPMPPAPPWGWHADHPIVNITWQEAKDYTRWLSQHTGQHYDLPPLHVWQYAALDNMEERPIDEVAWWGESAGGTTKAVGQKLPNRFELYDMQGNVWEWVDAKVDDGQLQAAGGSWDSHFEQCQWNSTTQLHPTERDFSVGFRVIQYDK